MPAYGFDYMTNGALSPFMMSSVLGGTLSLLPNPDKMGWLTWGFDPYSPGDDQYQQTAEIPTGAAIMRVPTKYVNGDDDEEGFTNYLATAAARCHEALQFYVNGLDVESVKDPTFAQRMGQAVTQLGNVMQAIDILNAALAQRGATTLRPQFGARYKAKATSMGGEVITQAMVIGFSVADLWAGTTVEDGFPDMESAEYRARQMNDKARDKWIKQQLLDIEIPDWIDKLADAGVITNPGREVQDYLVEHGFGLGDVLTEDRVHDTINYLWRRPLVLLSENHIYLEGTLPDVPESEGENGVQPTPVELKLQVVWPDEHSSAFFGKLSLEVTGDQPWLTATMDEEWVITVTGDVTKVNSAGLFSATIAVTESDDKVRNNNLVIPVTMSVADPNPAPADQQPIEEDPNANLIPGVDTTVPSTESEEAHTTFPAPPEQTTPAPPVFEQEVEPEFEEGEID